MVDPTKSNPTEHQLKRKQLIEIIASCPLYKKSEKAPDTFTATHIEDATRVTIQVAKNKVRIWKVNYEKKPAPFITDIDLEKFAHFVYNLAGAKL